MQVCPPQIQHGHDWRTRFLWRASFQRETAFFFVHLKYHSPYQNSSQTLPLCWSIPVLRSFRLGGLFPRKESTKSQNRLAWLREITRTFKKNSFLTITLIYILFTGYLAPHISVFVQRFIVWLPDIIQKNTKTADVQNGISSTSFYDLFLSVTWNVILDCSISPLLFSDMWIQGSKATHSEEKTCCPMSSKN